MAENPRFASLDFVNSEWTDWRGQGEPTDRIDSAVWWARFLTRSGYGPPRLGAPRGRELAELRRVRALMRKVIERQRMPTAPEVRRLNGLLARSPRRWAIDHGRARLVPARPGWAAVTAELIVSFTELVSGSELARLKRCANPDCSYVFYDESTNGSRRWCFSNVCGNLMHVRAFRARNE